MKAMKKTHWLRNTLIVLVACGLIGVVIAAVQFGKEAGHNNASASIQFSFDGAAEGKAPNGYPFDVSGFTTDEVLEAALEASGLTGTYTADEIRENLTVTGDYPDKIVEQMTTYVSLLDQEAESLATVYDYRATQYNVVLYNGFDKSISSSGLTELLGNIMTAYRAYFTKTYAVNLDREDAIANLAEYDYAQQLEAISESAAQQSRYAGELAEMAPDFKQNKKGFGDIAVKYQSLNSDIDRLNATITLNAVSKDRDRLKKRYEMEIRSLNIQLESLTEEQKRITEQAAAYDKDGIIYVSANGELSQVGSGASATYDKLVEMRKDVTDRIAETNAKIALYQARLDDMTGAAARQRTAGEGEDAAAVEQLNLKERKKLQNTVEAKITALTEKKDAIVDDFAAMLDVYAAQEINERTVLVTDPLYKTPKLLSGTFVVKVIRTAGPLCALGFIVCLCGLIISRWRRRNETDA